MICILFVHPPGARACQCPWLSSAVSLLSRGLPLPRSLPQLPVSPSVALPPPIVPLPFPASSTPSLPLHTHSDPLAFCAQVALGSRPASLWPADWPWAVSSSLLQKEVRLDGSLRESEREAQVVSCCAWSMLDNQEVWVTVFSGSYLQVEGGCWACPPVDTRSWGFFLAPWN